MEMVFNQHDTEKGVSSLSIILKSNASGGEFTTLNSKEILLLLWPKLVELKLISHKTDHKRLTCSFITIEHCDYYTQTIQSATPWV